jgi:hypothetical protein
MRSEPIPLDDNRRQFDGSIDECPVKRRVSRAEQNYPFLLSASCGIPPFICRKGR